MPVYTSAPSRPPTRNPTFPRKRTHDCPERRHEVVELGSAAAQRAPHPYRVHLHSGRDDEALRLPDRDASQRGHRHAVVRVLDRRRPRDGRRSLRAARPLYASGRVYPVRRDGGGLLPVLRAPRLLAHRKQRCAPRDLLLHLALYLGRRGGAVEPGCEAGDVTHASKPLDRSIVEGLIPRAVWMLAWPTMLQNLIGGLQGMVDHAPGGHFVGDAGHAAIRVAVQNFILGIRILLSVFSGMGVLVARFAGGKQPEK